MSTMIPFEKAIEIVLSSAARKAAGSENVSLAQSNGRILDRDIASDIDMPPFDKSAMDGYACRVSDLDALDDTGGPPLRLIETIAAGHKPQKVVGRGECSKIMTGAMIPEGADCVVIFEHTREENGLLRVLKKGGQTNICRKAEDLRAGDITLSRGRRITPAEIAVLASVGCDPVPVVPRPVVGVLATGSELVEPFEKPDSVQIRNSNSYQLCAQIERAGCLPRYFGIVEDTFESTDRMLRQALQESDVILLSGGVSMGDFDFVPETLRQNRVEIKFDKVAVKPGKPTVFGVREDKYFFGLAGNPVSTFVLFEILVRPFLFRLMEGTDRRIQIKARLKETLKRKKVERMEHIPVRLNAEGLIEPLEYHGSAHIYAYIKADGILAIPTGVGEVKAGSEVSVMLI
ncbi:MAG: gephyrin-like molybdotransferase Glp [bacterium]